MGGGSMWVHILYMQWKCIIYIRKLESFCQVSRLQKLSFVVVTAPPASVHAALALLRQQSWPSAKPAPRTRCSSPYPQTGVRTKALHFTCNSRITSFLKTLLQLWASGQSDTCHSSTSYSGRSKQATCTDIPQLWELTDCLFFRTTACFPL